MRHFTTILFLILGITSCAQKQEIRFESKFRPNMVYTMTFLTNSKSEVNFDGPKEKIDKIKASGIVLPMVTENTSKFITKTTTGKTDSDKSFKAIMEYGEIESIDKLNGEENKSSSPISGLIIKGQYNENNNFKIDTMISETLDQNLKNTLRASLEGIQSQIKFPDNPMKIGESFDQNIPMNIPIAGMTPVKVNINTNYKLRQIKDNRADFDIKQTVALDMNSNQLEVKASGGGKGKAEFDIEKMYIIKNETSLELNLTVTVNDLVVNAKISTQSNQDVKIEYKNASW